MAEIAVAEAEKDAGKSKMTRSKAQWRRHRESGVWGGGVMQNKTQFPWHSQGIQISTQ